MSTEASQEQGYLQAPEYEEAGFNTEAVQQFVAALRGKLMKVCGEELNKLAVVDITEDELKACVEKVDNYLSDMLGDLPLWEIGRRNDSLDALCAAYDDAQED